MPLLRNIRYRRARIISIAVPNEINPFVVAEIEISPRANAESTICRGNKETLVPYRPRSHATGKRYLDNCDRDASSEA